jgi:uncharacterized phage protein gp47/JayE
MSRDFLTIVQGFKNFIRAKNSKIEISEGTFTRDVVIDAPAKEFENLYSRIDQVSADQGIDTASEVGLDAIARNFSKVKKGARRSRGLVRFYSNSAPTADITIPAGTIVTTVSEGTTSPVQFRTTQTVTMRYTQALSYFNTSTAKYEVSVEVEAISGGILGNVGAGTILIVNGSVGGINGIYNPFATTGGLPEETSQQLQARLSTALAGVAIGTSAGLTSFVLEQDAVEDVLVVGGGATDRADIGAVDIYVKGKTYRNFTDEFSDPFSPYPAFVFSKQPVIPNTVSSVLASASGTLPSASWMLSKDSSGYGGSILGQDSLAWNTAVPTSSGSIVVNYQYNGLVEDLQSMMARDNQDILNSDTLIKWATEVPINISMNVRILDGFSGSDVADAVVSVVTDFLSTMGIGEEVQQADVAREVLNTAGVDDVFLPFNTFQAADGSVVRNSFNNLTIPSKSYASAGTITVSIV